jgi:hypothetical protein
MITAWILFFCGIYMLPFMVGNGTLFKSKSSLNFLTAVAFIPIILTLLFFQSFVDDQRENFLFTSLAPLSNLGLYKLANNYTIRRYGRQFYFYQRYSNSFESKNSTWIEFFMQMTIAFVPIFFWIAIGDLIF